MKRKLRFGPHGVLLSSLALLFSISAMWIVHAQQQAMFTGKTSNPDSSDLRVLRVQFESGARTYWHSHAKGQLIMAEKGRGRTQEQGKALKELGPGDAVYTAAGVMHWHGAASDQPFTQVTVVFGGATTWGEEVSEQQYSGKTR